MATEYVSKLVAGEYMIDLTADTADEAHVLASYTFHKNNGQTATGTCTFDSNTQSATAEIAEVLSGETFYARGTKYTGTMPNVGKQTGTINSKNGSVTISQGYHDGTGVVSLNQTEINKLVAGNIKSGVVLFGVTGSYGGEAVKATTKSATPSFQEQTILPGTGYDYLSQVTVAAIPVTKVLNSTGGYTVTVG